MVHARFDDLRPGRIRSFVLGGHHSTLIATHDAEVLDVLAKAEAEVRDGRWVAGWVSYEAAPAFGDDFKVKQTAKTPFAELPLAWFAVFDQRLPVAETSESPYEIGEWESTVDAGDYHAGVKEVRARIEAGDTYQVNLTFRMHADFEGDEASFYQDLINSQRGGYGAFLDAGRWVVLSASPELFFDWQDGRVLSKPMKGTAPRGRDLVEDLESSRRLRASDKERAENVMIVDMVRNDLGRIAQVGSVEVSSLFEREKYDTVWQLTSTVTAEPRADATLADVFGAMFPPASITGAPKVSTMDIITEIEAGPRGVYCGAIGFGGPGTSGEPHWVFNVGIRTVLVDRKSSAAWYGTGGGITYSSEASDEYAEAVLKARVLGRHSSDFSLIETIRWSPSAGFHELDRHIDRLLSSARYFDIPVEEADVKTALHEGVAQQNRISRVTLIVARDGGLEVDVAPAPRKTDRPLEVMVDDVPVDPADPFLRHKTSRRELYEQATVRHPSADDVILVNDRGEATETTIANLIVEIGGRWFTPPVDSGCLPGVERGRLVDSGRVEVVPVPLSELFAASRLARVNSLRGWEPLVLADEGVVVPD